MMKPIELYPPWSTITDYFGYAVFVAILTALVMTYASAVAVFLWRIVDRCCGNGNRR